MREVLTTEGLGWIDPPDVFGTPDFCAAAVRIVGTYLCDDSTPSVAYHQDLAVLSTVVLGGLGTDEANDCTESDAYTIFAAVANRLAPLYPDSSEAKKKSMSTRILAGITSTAKPVERLCAEVGTRLNKADPELADREWDAGSGGHWGGGGGEWGALGGGACNSTTPGGAL